MQNQKYTISRRAFIISIVIHVLILLFFLFYAFRHKINFLPHPPINRNIVSKVIFESPSRQVALRPNQQAVPIKQPITPPKKQQAAPQAKKYIPVALRPKRGDTTPSDVKTPEKEKKPIEKQAEVIEPKKFAEVKKQPVEIKEKLAKKEITSDKSGPIRELRKPKEPIAKKTFALDPQELKRIAISNLVKASLVRATSVTKTNTKRSQNKPTLMASIKSSLESCDGNSTIHREGDNRMPTLEDMKFICYEQEIEKSVVKTWNTYFEHKARFIQIRRSPAVNLPVLNEDGKIINKIFIAVSSGNEDFDEMWLECVSRTVFPPIPKHLGIKTYTIQAGSVSMDRTN